MYTTNSRSPSYLRLCKNLDSCLKDMNDCYKKLTDIQANAATTDNEKELARRFGKVGLGYVNLWKYAVLG